MITTCAKGLSFSEPRGVFFADRGRISCFKARVRMINGELPNSPLVGSYFWFGSITRSSDLSGFVPGPSLKNFHNLSSVKFSAGAAHNVSFDGNAPKYYVLSINYNNFTIRVVDALIQKDNCSSFPRHSLNLFYNRYWAIPYVWGSWPGVGYYDAEYYQSIVLVNCEHRILDSPLYVDAHPCINSTYYSGYWYIMLGSHSTYVMDLVDSCRVEQIVMASFLPKEAMDISYLDVHRIMSYGFEMSWFRACCDNYEENRCNLDIANITKYCYDGEEAEIAFETEEPQAQPINF
ncbi:hypothetical protein JCGZ_23781 [Jatropha curcas]|uniref:Uncharacterized protein n=1 Tax=Jatropha curcas TaxID=180498 RepID=A0A067LFG6_JATCU|nr:hypothetical protein JCGZ_23781 [Jatropha curcas]